MLGFAQPWAAVLIVLPWVLRHLLSPALEQYWVALKIPFYYRLRQINNYGLPKEIFQRPNQWLMIAIWVLLVISAMGPQWLGKPIEMLRQGRNLFLAVDLSNSMQIPDMEWDHRPVDRLLVVKEVAKKFIDARKGDRIGLILFGSKAYLQAPLTFDRKAVQELLDDASIGLAGPQTALGDAIGLAVKHLEKTPAKARVLILLTDGANNAGAVSPMQAAVLAKEYNIRIYTIGLGADELLVRGLLGSQIINPSSELDEKLLQQIATMTGGEFYRAKDTDSLKGIYRSISKLEPVSSDTNQYRPRTPFFHWPLALALGLSMLLVFRKFRKFEVAA